MGGLSVNGLSSPTKEDKHIYVLPNEGESRKVESEVVSKVRECIVLELEEGFSIVGFG